MALKKCKECGGQVSSKAKTCPGCGANVPKKTSLFTWLVLIVIVYGVYAASRAPTTRVSSPETQKSSSPGSAASSGSKSSARSPAEPAWTHSTSNDEMTGELSAYATSPRVAPKSRMNFPYSDTQSWLAVGCDSDSEWIYFGFTNAPNLNNTDIQDGYNVITTRVRWDETVENTPLTQKWGAAFIHFRDAKSAIARIGGSKSVLLELDWHSQRPVYFEFPLYGSSKAIAQIRELCAQ